MNPSCVSIESFPRGSSEWSVVRLTAARPPGGIPSVLVQAQLWGNPMQTAEPELRVAQHDHPMAPLDRASSAFRLAHRKIRSIFRLEVDCCLGDFVAGPGSAGLLPFLLRPQGVWEPGSGLVLRLGEGLLWHSC